MELITHSVAIDALLDLPSAADRHSYALDDRGYGSNQQDDGPDDRDDREDDGGQIVHDAHQDDRHEPVQESHHDVGHQRRRDQRHEPLVLQEARLGEDQEPGEHKLEEHQQRQDDGGVTAREEPPDRQVGDRAEGKREEQPDHDEQLDERDDQQDQRNDDQDDRADQREQTLQSAVELLRHDEARAHERDGIERDHVDQSQVRDTAAWIAESGTAVALLANLSRKSTIGWDSESSSRNGFPIDPPKQHRNSTKAMMRRLRVRLLMPALSDPCGGK